MLSIPPNRLILQTFEPPSPQTLWHFNHKYVISTQNFLQLKRRDNALCEDICSHLKLCSYKVTLWSCKNIIQLAQVSTLWLVWLYTVHFYTRVIYKDWEDAPPSKYHIQTNPQHKIDIQIRMNFFVLTICLDIIVA